MNTSKSSVSRVLLAFLAVALLFSGCKTTPLPAEKSARERVTRVGDALRPRTSQPLPVLKTDSTPGDYMRFALLKHPAVGAAFDDWRASVEAIAPARALPDPQFTFQADIADTLMSFMPGLMFDFMAPGKRAAMGNEVAAASEVAYRGYVGVVVRTAANVRTAWIELAAIDETIQLRESSLSAISQSLEVAGADYATGRGMATLEAQVRQINDAGKVRSAIDSLGDKRAAVRSKFKSALGLAPSDIDPPWPQFPLSATALPSEEALWLRVQEANPDLGKMRAMIEMAVAGVEVARKTGTPDFALGAMVDLKADPLMVRPTASLSLPIWRDKIAASIAAAQARRDAATANLKAEQLNMAAELAQMLFMVREADRMIAYIDGTALPNLERIIASSEAAVQSGMASAAMIPETRLMAFGMRQERIAALRERELAATSILLMTADFTPETAPIIASKATASNP